MTYLTPVCIMHRKGVDPGEINTPQIFGRCRYCAKYTPRFWRIYTLWSSGKIF